MGDPLAAFARHVEELEWSALLVDPDWMLRWVSPELQVFLGVHDETELGYGRHVLEAFLTPAWFGTVHPDSQAALMADLTAFFMSALSRQGGQLPAALVSEDLRPFIDSVEPVDLTSVWSTSFQYADPRAEPDTDPFEVDTFFFRASDDDGEHIGWCALFQIAVRPTLLSLLGRGDQRMYERMARLVQPGRREAAIMFCDLHGSGVLSRKLPSAEYFRLIRRLWTAIDTVVADNGGIVGKHAGDGATAFFLVDDLGDRGAAAAAAIASARRVHELAAEVFDDIIDSDCLMQVGLHWGASLYMGQLVPGGRLDVTALGDEVNEAARVQEAAGPDETLATKHLLERLTAADASRLGIDVDHLAYRLLSEVAPDRDKVVRDAGPLPVVAI